MRAVLICGILIFMPTAALGYTINQTGAYKDGAGTYNIIFDWQIGDTGFRLETTRGQEKKQFIHNGKVFYICGSLAKSQLDVLRGLNIQDGKLLASLERGVCQELSTDFTLRFFLSPWDAVTSVETGGSFASGLTMEKPETALTGKASSLSGTKCVEFSRKYAIGNKKEPAMRHAVDETACNASAVKWRQNFTRNLGMTLIRKPGGKPLYEAINDDVKKMTGFSLVMNTKVTGKDPAGKTYQKSFSVSTSAVRDGGTVSVALPTGYEVIDPRNLAVLAEKSKIKATPGTDSGNAVSDALKFLILGGNPATAVFKKLTDESDNKK